MFGIGTPELLVVLMVALIVLGPKKLPQLARMLGRGMRELRRAMQNLETLADEPAEDDPPITPQKQPPLETKTEAPKSDEPRKPKEDPGLGEGDG